MPDSTMSENPTPDGWLSARLNESLDVATPLAQLFEAAGHHLYFVGGVVRDSLLDISRAENDLDATTAARPAEIKALVSQLADAVWTQGERFGTIGCRIDGHIYEITTHRAEKYQPGSRKPVVAFGESLDEDLLRRDFTINAMAVDVIERQLIDLYGGEADLRDRVLRTPLDPIVSFSDDPLRMLRAARFRAGYNLQPVAPLVAALSSMTDRLEIVSAERKRDELEKMLMLPSPTPGLEMLFESGLLAKVLPHLSVRDVGQVDTIGARVAAVNAAPAHRWAALFNNADLASRQLGELKVPGAVVADVVTILRMAARVDEIDPTTASAVRRLAAMGNARVVLEDAIGWMRRRATATGSTIEPFDLLADTLQNLRSSEPDLDSPDVGLDGNQICDELGIEPGVDVGRAVAWLRQIRINEGIVPGEQLRPRLSQWWSTHS